MAVTRSVRVRGGRRFGFQSGSSEEFVEELTRLQGLPLVVDIGAGRGGKARWLASRGTYVVEIEPNVAYLEAQPSTALTERVAAVAEALPIRSGVAPGILAWNVLMWTEMEKALEEMARIAREAARLVLSLYRVRTGRPWTYATARRMLEEAGFTPAEEKRSGVQYRVVAEKTAERLAARA